MAFDISLIVWWGLVLPGLCGLLLLGALYLRARRARQRQAARRGREFEILTHIGTALSSSLDADALLFSMHAQLQKLMDVRNFYVAFLDEVREEIHFDFEVEDGRRLPPRRRPRANGLTEHIIATGRPLLVSGDVAAYARALGLAPTGRFASNYLGVPVILKGQPRGVIAVQSHEQYDAYDTEHLRVLEILAGQAAVALDNARLFAEVQRDAGQKAFLNHVARLTISTLSPSEMLATVVAEIARAFHYDFVSIAAPRVSVPPLPTPAFEICASTGTHRPEAQGMDLPVRYADQTLGILHLESCFAVGFPPDQVVVLQTLTDQIAVALNHANLFQQLQQQAITDSLTGLKTRRFFMEALQAEWRRARDAGDSFCILLLDLDEFKPLNDSYGHIEGDRILARVAELLEKKCRASNVVARYGGDEFTILVPACDIEGARQLPKRLQAALGDDPMLAAHRLRGSFGIAVYPDSGATPEDLLRCADADMYLAKQRQQHRAPLGVRAGA